MALSSFLPGSGKPLQAKHLNVIKTFGSKGKRGRKREEGVSSHPVHQPGSSVPSPTPYPPSPLPRTCMDHTTAVPLDGWEHGNLGTTFL